MNSLIRGYYISKHLGLRWVAYRLSHALQQKLGSLERRCPSANWDALPLSGFLRDSRLSDPKRYLENRATASPRFFFSPEDRLQFAPLLKEFDRSGTSPVSIADDLLNGRIRFFEFHNVLTGFPPVWRRNPFSGAEIDAECHWSRVPDFGFGDIKLIWEPNRFAFVYPLVRAWWRTGDNKYPDAFWRSVEDWRIHNPPNCGANWKCGQETSFRVMAWCFGLYGFFEAPSTSSERVSM